MPSKIQQYTELAAQTARQVTGSLDRWTAFLDTAARLYKYPFDEQLLIYAQRPEATACADYSLWNERMGRFVRRGSKGIALLDSSGDDIRLRYVFDVSDTGGGRRPYIWQYQPEHEQAIAAALEERYDVPFRNDLAEQFETIAIQLTDEYWNEHQRDILDIVDGSFLEEYDEFNIGAAFRHAAVASTTYTLLSRCGLEPGEYLDHEDFSDVFDFNTPRLVRALGEAVSQTSEEILRRIEITVKNYERERRSEHERDHLSSGRGLFDSEHRSAGADRADAPAGDVRTDAESLSEGTPPDPVERYAAGGDAVPPPAGDRPNSEREAGTDDPGTGGSGGRDGGAESPRSDGVGGPHEQLQGAGRGDHQSGADLQLSEDDSGQASLFPTETEQIESIAEAESAREAPSALSFTQEEIDHFLRVGSNSENARMRLAEYLATPKLAAEHVAFVKEMYHGGYGIQTADNMISAWYAEDGIHLVPGREARYVSSAQVISWNDATTRIAELLDAGQFATNVEVAEAHSYELADLSQNILYQYHDLTEEAREAGYISALDAIRGGGYPDEVERLSAVLADPAKRAPVIEQFRQFTEAWKEDPTILRFRFYRPEPLLIRLEDLNKTKYQYRGGLLELPEVRPFITEDEIDEALAAASGIEGSKSRIYEYFTADHTSKEKTDFLKREYGTGGRSHAVSRSPHSSEDHDSKGIKLRKGDAEAGVLSWSIVAKRIDALIAHNRYLTPEELAAREAALAPAAKTAAENVPSPDIEQEAEQSSAEVSAALSFEQAAQAQSTPEKKRLGRSRVERNYRAFARQFPEIVSGEYRYLQLRGSEDGGFMPLTIEYIGENEIAMSHTYELNGDLMFDPEMTFRIDRENGTLEPLTFRQDGSIQLYQEVYPAPGRWIPQLRNDLSVFTDQWLKNIEQQGRVRYRAIAVRDGEDVEISFDEAGKPMLTDAEIDREAARAIDAHEAEFGADGTRVFPDNEPLPPETPYEPTQEDIDAAIQSWNGDMGSKRRVQTYMADHAREKDTAAWLRMEFGGELDSFPVQLPGVDNYLHLTWPKLQRRLAQLVQQDRFFTEQELDNFEDIDVDYVREQISRPPEESPFVQQVMADAERIAAEQDADEPPDLSEQPVSFDGDTLTIGVGPVFQEIDIELPDDLWPETREQADQHAVEDVAESAPQPEPPQEPWNIQPYKIGDTVYLDDTAFEITDIRDSEIQLRDPTLFYPIFRSENREHFEQLLRRDPRNEPVIEYLSAPLGGMNLDLREVLIGDHAMMELHDREIIAGWFRNGEGNTRIAERLGLMYAGAAETFMMETGEGVDYFGSTTGLEINIDDKYGTKQEFSWTEIAQYLRAMFQQERYGFFHEADEPEPEPNPAQEQPAPPTYHTETVEEYPAEETGLAYDITIEQLHFDEPTPTHPAPTAENFRITDEHLGEGGYKAKFRANMDAIYTLKAIENEGRQATPEEQEILSRYVGWGGLADAFDADKREWRGEYKELEAALSPEEYKAARASTLNAHYTSPTVIHAIYEALGNMGFKSGNILEPSMGVGNFFGMLPDEMRDSRLYGVELDSISGRIAQQLYPKANITVAGFETTDRRDFFDVAVGNVPFGQYQIRDRAYDKLGFSIHNYFFAKALDQVRPGGVVAFVTSRYTMDAKDSTVRKYLAQRAELLGAIRLPNNAFKANAGTDVVSDIIFLQKRDRPIDIEPDWVQTAENADGFRINSYFIDHPDMILGQQTSESTQYGRQDFTVAPIEGANLADQLHEAVQNIHGAYQEAELPDLGEGETVSDTIPADPDVKNYSFTVVDGEVYFRENSVMVRAEMNATAKARVKGMIELRDCVHRLIDLQMYESDPAQIRIEQARLNRLYDTYTGKYGLINDRGNRLAFAKDSSYYLLCSLEVLDEDGRLERKADMFTKRTIKQAQTITHADTASDALALSLAEKARVDMAYMAQLTGKTEEELAGDLRGVIFRLPMQTDSDGSPLYVTADEYLSGNVREKLHFVQQCVTSGHTEYQDNVEALLAAQPKDLEASEIDVRLGATWIDKRYIQQFMEETFDPPYYLREDIQVNFSPFTAEWNITHKGAVGGNNVAAYVTYGTGRANAYRILEDTLNLRDVRIYDTVTDPDGKEKRVLNSKETTLAQQKQQAIKDAFREWIWKDPERRQTLVRLYNEKFNCMRPREYDGSHITFSGINPEITLREHQLSAIAHILYGGNTLLAHEVGAGKTFEMVAAAMESKRLGLCQKSLFVVPNHLTEQWGAEFLRLYPSAKILVTTKKDFETRNRKKFCARIATGDYDAIIIGHSQFERIPVSQERQQSLLEEQLAEIEEGLDELRSSGAEQFTIKSLERTKKSIEARLEKLTETGRKDDVITFEQLGVDRLFVDEAHSYKNLFLYTKMRNVAGLSTTDAQKSSDMFMKCRYIDEVTGGKGVVFATGTPVSNSMTELYTMMRYLQHDMLRENGWAHFDCWASQFGETTTAIELAPEGTGYRARTRFAKFFNLPELISFWKEAADVKTADQLNLPRPEAVFHTEVAQPTEIQKGMVQELSMRAARVHSGAVDAKEDNMLKITSDGRKLGLDQRIINPNLPDDPGSKVNMCVDNIFRIWQDGAAEKLTQLLFCDISTPKGHAAATQEKAARATGDKVLGAEFHSLLPDVEPDAPFSVYDDIREKLIARGIPAEQIAFIHDANTEARKKELFAKVRSGQVRVLMGSTFKMGAGMNVQDRLIALHDLDCPWHPGDLEQRAGRIIRQGNKNSEVHIYRYVTEGTFDSYLWQTVENKQKFISQIMTSKSPVRSCEDLDETALSYAEIKALCAGDPRIKEKMDLDIDVARLKLLKSDHSSRQYRLEDAILTLYPKQIETAKEQIMGFKADMETLAAHPIPEEGFVGMEVRGDHLTDKDNAGAAILEACKDVKGFEPVEIGHYRGMSMSITLEDFGKNYFLTLHGEMSHRVELGKDARGNLIRIENQLAAIPQRLKSVEVSLENVYAQMEAAKVELGKPFPQEAELQEKSARLAELNAILDIGDKTQDEPLPEDAAAKRLPPLQKGDRPSVLAMLKQRPPQREAPAHPRPKSKNHEVSL